MNLRAGILGVRDVLDEATAPGVEVVTGWQGATDVGTVLTVAPLSVDDAGQPIARVESQVMGGGFDTHDVERLSFPCTLVVPSDSTETPDSMIDEVDGLLSIIRSAIRAALQSNRFPGAFRAYIADVSVYLMDHSTGFAPAASFTVVIESYT
jgi:hypothetical protein